MMAANHRSERAVMPAVLAFFHFFGIGVVEWYREEPWKAAIGLIVFCLGWVVGLVVKDRPKHTIEHALPGWRRVWGLLGFAMPPKAREKYYEPGHQDLLADLLESRRFRTKWARRWLNFCFALNTTWLFLGCWRAVLGDATVGFLMRLLPDLIKRWWRA